jgi:hypothetical protein
MLLKEYSLMEKAKLVKLINYLQPLVSEDKLEKILDFYKYFDESYYDIENKAVYTEFLSTLEKLASDNSIVLPEELQ